jgi:hypothetical protein
MRKTKYLNQTFDNNWTCVHVGVASVCGAFYEGTRKRTKRPGHRNYYYLFVRKTSDGKFDKMVRLNGAQAAKVYKGAQTVEQVADKKASKVNPDILNKVGYYFL